MTLSMHAAVSGVEKIIIYQFRNPLLLWEALQAPGSNVFQIGDRQISHQGHKRMAMLGDKWLDLVILMDWFVENVSTGQGSNRLSSTTSDNNLQRVCREFGLQRFLNNDPSRGGAVSEKTMATLIEAIIGAVAEDRGLEAVRSVMENLGLLGQHQHE